MKQYYLCPKCKSKTLLPRCNCGYEIPFVNSIYRFFNGASVKLEGDKQYIGYDNIGEDFEPEVTYWDANNTERYGVYAACGDLIAKKFGTKINVLDLGAGLGYSFVPQIESYKAAVSAQARQLLDATDPVDNPITAFLAKNK